MKILAAVAIALLLAAPAAAQTQSQLYEIIAGKAVPVGDGTAGSFPVPISGSGGSTPAITVNNLAALEALSTATTKAVIRLGYITPGDSAPLIFNAQNPSGACTLNGGAGDGGTQVPSSDGNCWLGDFSNKIFDVRQFGASGNGTGPDTNAIRNSQSACQIAGGDVYFPPSGAAYVFDFLNVGNGCRIKGNGASNFQGFSVTVAQWTDHASWLKPTSTTNCGITLNGNGSAVDDINIIRDQPIPGGSFTPTIYPYDICGGGNYQHVKNVNIVGASHGIQWAPDFNGTACTGGAGSNSYIEDVAINAFDVGVYANCLNDEPVFKNIQISPKWYATNAAVTTYTENNLIGVDWHYVDNFVLEGFQSYLHHVAFNFTNDTVLGATHSAYNFRMSDIDLNIGDIAMLINGNATVRGQISNLIEQQDTGEHNAFSDTLNQLASDTLALSISNFRINDAGGTAIVLGNGVGGNLTVGTQFQLARYSAVSGGQNAVTMAAGSTLSFGGVKNITYTAGTATIAGAGANSTGVIGNNYIHNWTTQGGSFATVGTGANQAITSADEFIPETSGYVQGRLSGTYTVTAAVAGAASIFMSGYTGVTTSLDCSSTGNKTFNSGYKEFGATTTAILGNVTLNLPAGCGLSFGEIATYAH